MMLAFEKNRRKKQLPRVNSLGVILVVASLGLAFGGCATPEVEKVSIAKQIQMDNEHGPKIAEKVEPKLELVPDEKVIQYLTKMTIRLVKSSKLLRHSETVLKLIKADRWKNYSMPGLFLYVNTGPLKEVQFESTLAAILAFELGHIVSRHSSKKFEKLDDKSNLELGKLFLFNTIELRESVGAAVSIMYDAKIDARGLIQLWKIYRDHPGNSPYSGKRLDELTEQTHREIVQYTPLQNPTVRSNEFLKVQQRLKRL